MIPLVQSRPIIDPPPLPSPITTKASGAIVHWGLTQDNYKGSWYDWDDWRYTVSAVWFLVAHLNFELVMASPGHYYPKVELYLHVFFNDLQSITVKYTDGTSGVFAVNPSQYLFGSYNEITLPAYKIVSKVQFSYWTGHMYSSVSVDCLEISYGY
ncbi:MAG: hypothetical protein FK733_00915 [Asgard group archaeon]|nr:hypothetical protein [Asgard group archaeon]